MPYKTCPNCKTDNGVRSHNCKSCNHSFQSKEKSPPATFTPQKNFSAKNSFGYNLIFAPGLPPHSKSPFCPVELKSSNREDIIKWSKKLHEMEFNYCGRTTRYARCAIEYFVHDYIPMYVNGVDGENPEYKFAINVIRETLPAYPEES